MSKEIKRIPVKEFRELGYLQEVNRKFLHPLGLALEVTLNDDDTESITGIWDCREDLEGILYDLKNSNSDRIENFNKNMVNVRKQAQKHIQSRIILLGDIVEPIPPNK